MVSRKTIGSSLAALAAAGAMLLVASTADAAMSPVPAARQSNPDIQLAWCGVGFHVGPLGACVGGGPGFTRGDARLLRQAEVLGPPPPGLGQLHL